MLCWLLVLVAPAVLAAPYVRDESAVAWGRPPGAEAWQQRLPPGHKADDDDVHTAEKRAMLAMLSRWRPLTSAVYQLLRPRTPRPASQEALSAETRGSRRPLGQPLRWGR
ncbi:uncharacterized protein LOC124556097 [Schistocerca americana]|uniref:uncharacterized protein LOC124556097 n=1 Tax=Schistocerca americana TaxID=7009 RepID=UPI001F4FE730|nr:uncharacterized protein LOC124556097 [Schistocerca americana]XP_047104109.1 uncharacterized protein LOC124722984 [Schistocerca piceifrons]XP_049781707.1 uncharacterized protein LOC126183628 [Schistocerca cancellata]XP_049845671.1 uncharacterized protein LOC126298401 [Schistocerca gregaria]XP_049955750.1 uncharacterized protein LOC126471568 [Schistocerca serialis cubense]UGX04201.1 HanSolin [Schistocerca gregaria]